MPGSSPNWPLGFVPTPAQWNGLWAGKADYSQVFDVNGNSGFLTVTPTNGTTARSLANLTSDAYNLKNLGALLNGLTSDETAINAALAQVPNGGILDVPIGNWPTGFSPAEQGANSSILINLLGTLDYGTSALGTNPVTQFGDGQVVQSFSSGSVNFYKNLQNCGVGTPVLNLTLNNANTGLYQYDVLSVLNVTMNAQRGVQNYCWPIISNLNIYSALANTVQHVGMASSVNKFATADQLGSSYTRSTSSWTYFGTNTDNTGLPPGPFSQLMEFDIFCNGPDGPENSTDWDAFSPLSGGRQHFLLDSSTTTIAARANSTAYTVGQVIQVTPTSGWASGIASTYVCSTAGTTAASQPTYGSATARGTLYTVTDGTAVFQYGTTVSGRVSRSIQFQGSFGTGIVGNATFENAFLDTTYSTFNQTTSAAIRLAANHLIDFDGPTAHTSTAGQNTHTLGYSTSTFAWQYVYNGTPILQVFDNSGFPFAAISTVLSVNGSLHANGGMVLTGGCSMAGGVGVDTLNLSGALKLGSAYTSGAPTATGYINITDSGGTVRKVLCA